MCILGSGEPGPWTVAHRDAAAETGLGAVARTLNRTASLGRGMKPGVAIPLVLGLVVVASNLGVGLVGAAPGAGHPVEAVAQQAPADPETDGIGWENGYWFNESISVDQRDGLDDAEREAVVSRAMARVEVLRGLEFNRSVPVEVITREELRERRAGLVNESVPVNDSLHQNVKFEAVFFFGEDTDAIERLRSELAGGAIAQYNRETERIVIGTSNTDSPRIDELTLAHELIHAVQDQHNLTANLSRPLTEDAQNAQLGITEGDPQFVSYLYRERCGAEWSCVEPVEGPPGGSSDRHVGLALLQLVPYSDGPVFVQHVYEAAGWAGVDAVYSNPPASSEQVIHPDRYPDDRPVNVTVEDRSTRTWYVPELNASIDHATFGEAGLFLMLWYPSFETRSDLIVPVNIFNQPAPDLYDYADPATTGWAGDKLLPYVTNTSTRTNETGYVWKTEWDSTNDAAEFHAAYQDLLTYHDASVWGPRTWVIEDGPFADAFYLDRSGRQVTVVNAPTVTDLKAIKTDIVVERVVRTDGSYRTVTLSRTPDPGPVEGGPPGTAPPDAATPDPSVDPPTTTPGQPGLGFGLVAALIALALIAVRRYRR